MGEGIDAGGGAASPAERRPLQPGRAHLASRDEVDRRSRERSESVSTGGPIGISDLECDSAASSSVRGPPASGRCRPVEGAPLKGRQALQRVAAGGMCAGQIGAAILAALAARDSPLGDCVRRHLAGQPGQGGKRQRDVLPLPVPRGEAAVEAALERLLRAGGVKEGRQGRPERGRLVAIGAWQILCIVALNWMYSAGGRICGLDWCGHRPTVAQLASLAHIRAQCEALVDRVDEETGRACTSPTVDFVSMLARKRLSYGGDEVSLPEPLTLAELLPGLPARGEAASVDPLAIASAEVREALLHPERVCDPDGICTAQAAAKVHATPREWASIVAELLAGVPIPPATRVLRLIINMVPSNRVQRAIDGDIGLLPVGGEHHVTLLADGETLLWSSDDIKGCFHVFRLPSCWRPWMALSAPVDPLTLGRAKGPMIWVAVAVVPMGWLSAVGIVQHLSRQIVLGGAPGHRSPAASAELRRGAAYPLQLHRLPRAWWKVYVDNVEFGEVVSEAAARDLVGQVSVEQLAVRAALDRWGIRRNETKVVERSPMAVSMGSGVDGRLGRVAPALPKLLLHLALACWVLSRADCGPLWVAAAAGRWCFDFGHRRAAFGTLDAIWKEIASWKGRRPVSRRGGGELYMACAVAPLVYTDLRAKLFPWPLATDASESGGGTCVACGLTEAGWAAAASAAGPLSSLAPAGLIAFEFFGGAGGWRQAHDRIGAAVVLRVICEKDPAARAVSRRAWPGGIEWPDITKVTREMVAAVRRAAPGATGISVSWSLPFQDLSEHRSALLWEIPRVARLLELEFGSLPWVDVVENVASMTAESCTLVSEGLGRHPVLIDAAGISRARRPRLFWCSFPVGDGCGRRASPLFDVIELEAEVEPAEIWMLPDGCWDLGSSARLPAFTRAVHRLAPPPAPAGLRECKAHESARWAADEYRFSPFTYRDACTLASAEGGRRVLQAPEREVLLGFWPGHTEPARPSSARSDDTARCALLGGSLHVGVVAWLLGQGLQAAGLIEAPPTAPEIQRAFCKELAARALGERPRTVLPLLRGRVAVAPCEGLEAPGASGRASAGAQGDRVEHEDEITLSPPASAGASANELSAARAIVYGLLRHADHRGSDVRLDIGLPFRAKVWPRAPIASDRWAWQTVLAHGWKRQGRHINELELQEVLAALKWFARRADRHHSRLGILIDSQVVLSVCAKGRSSLRRLNHLVQRIDAQILACNLYPFYGYVTSKMNPADAPSRQRERGRPPDPSEEVCAAPPGRPSEAPGMLAVRHGRLSDLPVARSRPVGGAMQ
ncbi:unnamed protein product, partial [Prorocentrum cordatum]